MGSPFPLKIGTDKLNIHSSGNLPLKKISLNMLVKDFKLLSPPNLNISRATPDGLVAFLIFIQFIAHRTSSTSFLLTAPSTLLCINAITPFIFNIHQLFHMLLPDFLSIIHIYFHRPTFIFKTTNPNNISLIPSPLLGNSNQLNDHHETNQTYPPLLELSDP